MEPIRFNIEASSLKARLRMVSVWIPKNFFLAETWAPCASHLDPIHLVPGSHMPPIWFNMVSTWTSCPIHPEPIQFSSQPTWNRNCSGLAPKFIRRASTWGPYGSCRGHTWNPYRRGRKPCAEFRRDARQRSEEYELDASLCCHALMQEHWLKKNSLGGPDLL